jgi:hypothetical protein
VRPGGNRSRSGPSAPRTGTPRRINRGSTRRLPGGGHRYRNPSITPVGGIDVRRLAGQRGGTVIPRGRRILTDRIWHRSYGRSLYRNRWRARTRHWNTGFVGWPCSWNVGAFSYAPWGLYNFPFRYGCYWPSAWRSGYVFVNPAIDPIWCPPASSIWWWPGGCYYPGSWVGSNVNIYLTPGTTVTNDWDDGIDIVGSQHVLVNNCFIQSKDDCIAVKAGPQYFPSFQPR